MSNTLRVITFYWIKIFLKVYINDCITFYDDTVSKIFEFKWVKIRALDEDGNLDDRCWSNVGSITESTQKSFQEINLSPKGCLFTKTIQVKNHSCYQSVECD